MHNKYNMADSIFYEIASAIPSLHNIKTPITKEVKDIICNIVKVWIPSFKYATLNKKSEEEWQTIVRQKFDSNEWNIIVKSVYNTLKIPSYLTYHTYEAVQDLDSWIYRALHPFPSNLEYSPEELRKREEIASRPL